MAKFNSLYPRVAKFIAGLTLQKETFLYERMSNIEYPFWNEFEYFLSIADRFSNTNEIVRKLSLTNPQNMDSSRAWGYWRDFRSAQFEVTMIFFIEKYFGGSVTELITPNKAPTPDFKVRFNQAKFMIEAKAQSGQQHGDRHPMDNGPILFDPKDETDLRSWLFEKKISSRSGKTMEPMVIAAEKKGAHILTCQTDYIKTKEDFLSQLKVICPQNKLIEQITLQGTPGKPMEVWFFQAKYPCTCQLTNVKEIWLCNLSSSDYKFIVLSQKDAILMNHLKNRR